VRAVELLGELTDDCGARGVGEEGELAQVLAGGVTVRRALERSADEDDALLLRREGDQVPSDGPDSMSVRFAAPRRG
jgi:hypothetical protein